MRLNSKTAKSSALPSLTSMTGVLAVIHPRVYQRGSVETHAREMVAARMALALRDNPPQALQLAMLQAYERGRVRRS